MNRFFHLIGLCILSVSVGCAAYAVPGKGANFREMGMSQAQRDARTDPAIGTVLAKQPLAKFPATVAIVRIQDSQYEARTVRTYGTGSFCVVLTRDVEKPEQFDQLAKLPMMAGLEPVNRLELPPTLNSDEDLRAAGAALHADMILIYTFDDNLDNQDVAIAATMLTIGIAPTKKLTVISTASAVLMDTRDGFIYGAAESTEKKSALVNAWGEVAAGESLREDVETKAFASLCGEVQKSWTQVVSQYAPATRP